MSNYFTIGINRSFYKIDSTILMWQDASLWFTERSKLKDVKAIKYYNLSYNLNGDLNAYYMVGKCYQLSGDTANVVPLFTSTLFIYASSISRRLG